MAISALELRHIIESAFLPLECRCTSPSKDKLTVEIIDQTSGVNLVVGGIDVASLGTSRAISDLIAALRTQFAGVSQPDSMHSVLPSGAGANPARMRGRLGA